MSDVRYERLQNTQNAASSKFKFQNSLEEAYLRNPLIPLTGVLEWREMASREKRKHTNSTLDNPIFQNFSREHSLSYRALFSYLLFFAPFPLSDCLEQALIGIGFEPFHDEIPRGSLYEWKTEYKWEGVGGRGRQNKGEEPEYSLQPRSPNNQRH